MPDFSNAIAGIESGGKYGILGPVTRTGDRAYGKYQVMGANIPQWTNEVLGAPMSPQDFLASPKAQDAVFNAKFGQYVSKYGPEGAARAWFAGPGGMNNLNATDQLGTSVQQYGQKFSQLLNGPQQSYAQTGTISNTGGMPQAGSQGELAGGGSGAHPQTGGGMETFTNPTQGIMKWTGAPSQDAPDPRTEDDFKAPPISGPSLPSRQQLIRQALIKKAFQNMPRGYQFKLG